MKAGDASPPASDRQEKRRRFHALLLSRLAIFTALGLSNLFFGIWRGGLTDRPSLVLYALVALVYLGTAASWLWLRLGGQALEGHLQGQIVLDVLFGSVLVFLTGGVESPFCFFLALPIIITAVFFSRGRTFLTAVLSCLALTALFVLESRGVIRPIWERQFQPLSPTRVAYLLVLNFLVYFAVAALAGTLGEQLRRTGRTLQRTRLDLERLRALHGDIVNSLLSGLLVVDSEGRVSALNPVAAEILETGDSAAVGRPAVEIFPELALVVDWQRPGQVIRTELLHRTSRGETPVGLTLSPLKSSGDQAAGILIHMQDLTERRLMEASVKQAEKMAALGQMAAAMAHEIRNPLASLSGAVQMLRGGSSDPAEQRLMEIVLRETRRLDRLLSDFLAFAQPRPPKFGPCRLDALAEETVAVFGGNLQQGLELKLEMQPVEILADADQLRQVLWNLLTNAAEAMSGRGRILVRVHPEGANGATAVLEVQDSAPPIAAEIRERIFEPFFTTKEGGTGLGLAIVERVMRAHSGRVELESGEQGNRFSLFIPVRHG